MNLNSNAINGGSGRESEHPLGLDVETLESSFALLEPKLDEVAKQFYEKLFSNYPGVKPLFGNTSVEKQVGKLTAALKLVVNNLRKVDVLSKALIKLGASHQNYGAEPAHYGAVAETLIGVMKEFAGPAWTAKVNTAWSDALEVVAGVMLGAYDKTGMETNTMSSNTADNQELIEQVNRWQSAVNGVKTAMMMIDRDFKVTYLNDASKKLLKDNEEILRTVFPGFDANNMLGACIDMFHKDPAHQRRLLNESGNLPYETDIEVGPLKFHLAVGAIKDSDGNYTGNTLEWDDVTEKREQENNVFRLQAAVDTAQTAMMMIDRDFIITYMNESSKALLKDNETELRIAFPGFDADKIMGACIDMFHKDPSHQRKLLGDPRNLPYSTDIDVGPLKFHLDVGAINDLEGNYIGNTLEWQNVTEQRASELEISRLKSAVNGAQANLMLCDENLVITYANPAVVGMLAKRQNELRQIWPSLDANNLVGQCIDQFHKNPAHQRALLGDPSKSPANAEIKVAELEFDVNATYISDADGNYMGNMVEWKDITEEKDAEHQIESLITSAVDGELDTRIQAEEYNGFLKTLGDGINQLMDAVVMPVQEGKKVMSALAEGDLTETMNGEFNGEFAELRDAINSSITNLLNMVGQINTASNSITVGSGEIAKGNQDLSQRTEEQAANLEETASSMEEMTSTVKQNADNARQANQLATAARDQASKGGDVVKNAVIAMSEINQSSKKIADIIGVIDEIAFQTNLLALNAAVEAARAGEQGRGFAVVAGEVRNLAQRSAGAAKEIKALISDSVDKVDEGSRLVDESGKTLEEIVEAVKKVSDIIAEIAAASQEQSAGIEEVNKAIAQMDEMTQQNAALVEEAAAASESVEEQAKQMSELMLFFNTGEAQNDISLRAVASSASKPGTTSRPASKVKTRAKPAKRAASGDDEEWEEF